jgi:tetratricopeptide (TPR) repeat protein
LLYELLLPYRDLAIVVGNASVCLGAAARFLGQLASLMGRWDDAEAHFRRAMELDARMAARTWLPHSQFQYSRMLFRRGRPGDTASANELLDAAAKAASDLGLRGLQIGMQSADG